MTRSYKYDIGLQRVSSISLFSYSYAFKHLFYYWLERPRVRTFGVHREALVKLFSGPLFYRNGPDNIGGSSKASRGRYSEGLGHHAGHAPCFPWGDTQQDLQPVEKPWWRHAYPL